MKLTSTAVHDIVLKCLYGEREPRDNAILVVGVVHTFGFHPGRVAENKKQIDELLDELPPEFRDDGGGGWSFLNACVDKHGELWGQHKDMEALVCLGIAAGSAAWVMKELTSLMPGGMPYFVIKRKPHANS